MGATAGDEPIRMSMTDLLALPVSVPLEVAARAWGMGRAKAFELKRREALPFQVHKVGASTMVTKAALFASLGLNFDGTPLAVASGDGPTRAA